ncbi:hypothetical protein [Pseudomonas sp. OF001]|jgi:hypothetical protein|nr:hypothetical protein [Pseudomonas sp. OF001]
MDLSHTQWASAVLAKAQHRRGNLEGSAVSVLQMQRTESQPAAFLLAQ